MRMMSVHWRVAAGIFVLAPFNGYILDKLGYGFVLIVINSLSLSAVVLQSIPVVQLQVRFRSCTVIDCKTLAHKSTWLLVTELPVAVHAGCILQLAFPLVREKLFVAVSTMDSCWVKQVIPLRLHAGAACASPRGYLFGI